MNTELELALAQQSPLSLWKKPEDVLEEARTAAVALKKVIEAKDKKVFFNNEQYLEREDWGMVGRFYGCTPKTIETRYVTFGDVYGWEATAVVIDREMREIGRAESMCLSDEDNWGDVPVYEWEDELDSEGKKIWVAPKGNKKGYYKGKRVQTGSKPKPLFQLRSMAQTRAEAKALKGIFGFVVVLAGYKPSVAEEMTGNENPPQDEGDGGGKAPVTQPGRASQKAEAEGDAPKDETEEISGLIEKGADGKEGTRWLTVAGKLVFIPTAGVEEGMKAGSFITVRAAKKHSAKAGDYWQATKVLKVEEMQEGELVAEKVQNLDPGPTTAAEVVEVSPEIKNLFESGEVKTASQLPPVEGKREGTIGVKAAQRLYSLMTQNGKKTGLTEELFKEHILSKLPVPLEHLRDLDLGMKGVIERLMTGEDDWQAFTE